MHFFSTIILVALSLDPAWTHPHHHIHEKRVDYKDPSLYKNLDWSKINYGQSAPAQPSPQENQPAPQPKAVAPAAPKPASPPPKTEQKAADTPAASTSSKRGLVYNWESPSLSVFSPYQGKPLSWAWNWDSTPFNLPSGYNFAPTLHTLKPESTGPWAANAKKAISAANGAAVHLLGFNEPDIKEQADLAPGAAADAWRQYMQPFAGGNVKLGSPQVSNGVGTNAATGQPYGLDWLSGFLGSCSGCTVDFLVVHWYGCTDGCAVDKDVAAFKEFVGKAEALAKGKKIWITEFATHNPDQAGFIRDVLPWLDGQGGVERYSYFMVKEGSLLQGGGLSDAGKAYVSA